MTPTPGPPGEAPVRSPEPSDGTTDPSLRSAVAEPGSGYPTSTGIPSRPTGAPPPRRLLVTAVLVAWAVVGLGILALATTGAVSAELAVAAIGLTLLGDLLVLAVLVRSMDRAAR